MSKTKRDDRDDTCAHCGNKRRVHYAVNYADGPMVSGEVLICPVGTFLVKNDAKEPER